ncbi:MAG: hypothetical protein QOC85_631 [Streptomyces sp.]|nr:hypothetical protein [Streptomyces sp.]
MEQAAVERGDQAEERVLCRPQRADDGETQQIGAERGQRVPQGGPDLGVGQAVGDGGVQREQRDGDREHRITEGDKSFRIDHDVTAEETQTGLVIRQAPEG